MTSILSPFERRKQLRVFACEFGRRLLGSAAVITVEEHIHFYDQTSKTLLVVRCEDDRTLDGAVASLRCAVRSKIKRRFCFAERKKGKFVDENDFWAVVMRVVRCRGTVVVELWPVNRIEERIIDGRE